MEEKLESWKNDVSSVHRHLVREKCKGMKRQPFSFSKFVTVAQLPTLVHVINRSRSGGTSIQKKAGELVVPLRD